MTKEHQSRDWNYHPDLPIEDPSVLKWPPNTAFLHIGFAKIG
jgi:lathosterol oxidase